MIFRDAHLNFEEYAMVMTQYQNVSSLRASYCADEVRLWTSELVTLSREALPIAHHPRLEIPASRSLGGISSS